MKFLMLEKENEERAKIILIHNFPEQLAREQLELGVIVEDFEQPNVEGKVSSPYWNYKKQKVEFEFKDIPKPEPGLIERINALEQSNAELMNLIMMQGTPK